jgi:hypothetical protein
MSPDRQMGAAHVGGDLSRLVLFSSDGKTLTEYALKNHRTRVRWLTDEELMVFSCQLTKDTTELIRLKIVRQP